MNDTLIPNQPILYSEITSKCEEIGFTMPSDLHIGSLLKTLIASKPHANILELGTGIGLSLAWMIDGMDQQSRLTSIDNDPELIKIVKGYFDEDERVEILCMDGAEWIRGYEGSQFDLIFADAWPGKYSDLDETLSLTKVGGLYVVDDMTEQPNWPGGHSEKATALIQYLEKRDDFNMTKLDWSTGVIICSKKY